MMKSFPFVELNQLKIAILFILLAGCTQVEKKANITQQINPSDKQHSSQPIKPIASTAGQLTGAYYAESISGDFANYPQLEQFIVQLQQKYGFKPEYLKGLFSQAKRKQWTLDYLNKSDQSMASKPSKGGWSRYRSQFLDQQHIQRGVAFWHLHRAALDKASQQYGVPAEYILGILGVETSYGANLGNHRVLDALTTLSFDYKRRGDYFQSELEKFLVMAANEKFDPVKPVGSFAGAMGLGQFMPSSFLQWAVDFNADGQRDIWNAEDAIASVANYFAQHGWQQGQAVVSATRVNYATVENLETGLDHEYALTTLKQVGVEPMGNCQCNTGLRLLLLRHLNQDEYLIGHTNFYVISRYNHSTYYAMAVHELAQAIKQAYY